MKKAGRADRLQVFRRSVLRLGDDQRPRDSGWRGRSCGRPPLVATTIPAPLTALKLAVCIDRNTAAMEDCTIELRRIRESA